MGSAESSAARLERAAEELRREGTSVVYRRTIRVTADETSFHLLDAAGEAEVEAAARRADIQLIRVVAAEDSDGRPEPPPDDRGGSIMTRVHRLLTLSAVAALAVSLGASPAAPAGPPPPPSLPSLPCVPQGVPIPPLPQGAPKIKRCPKKPSAGHANPTKRPGKPTQPKAPIGAPKNPQLSSCARTAAPLKVEFGALAPDGVAELSGGVPGGHVCQPVSFALSRNAIFDASDVTLGAGVLKAPPGHFKTWVSLPDAVVPGSYQLLACAAQTPSRAVCGAVGTVHVGAAPAIPAATASLDPGAAVTKTVDDHGGTISVKAKDGTTFVLTVPQHATPYLPITMTPVTSLNPASAVGSLVTGVMIEPAGEALTGLMLEIRRPSVPKGARAVAFGGADPTGGAFPLISPVTTDTRIPIAMFGGYGIATATGRSASMVRSVACSRSPRQLAASARVADGGARPKLSCVAFAEKWRALQDAVAQASKAGPANATIGETYGPPLEAAANAVADEMGRITGAPPTESGAIELEILLGYGLSVERQIELFGLKGVVGERLDGQLSKALDYQLRLISDVCQGAKRQPSGIYLDYFFQSFSLLRQAQLLGGSVNSAQALLEACIKRVRFQLTGNDDATVDYGHWETHVVVSADATIKGTSGGFGKLDPGRPALKFTTSDAKATGDFLGYGGVATLKSASGILDVGVTAWVNRRIRCDKNRKFVVDREYFMSINADGLWNDQQSVQLTQNGYTIPGTAPAGAAATSWNETYPPTLGGQQSQRIQLKLDGPEVDKAANGSCKQSECTTYSYKASLEAKQLDN